MSNKVKTPVINPEWIRGIASKAVNAGVRLAKFAGYNAARYNTGFKQQTRYNTNPNSTMAQIERVQMNWDGEFISKNTPLGRRYHGIRRAYCSTGLNYNPDTGDSVLDEELKDYLKGVFKVGGINCSMQEAFSRVADVEQPMRGDAALVWYRDESQLRLIEVSADQIGELYQFTQPFTSIDGTTYFAGMYFSPNGQRVAMKVYERGFNQIYTNPQIYNATDVIYFQDNIIRGVRGVTKFAAAIIPIMKQDKWKEYEIDTAQKNSKTAVVIRNEQGMPDELTYEQKATYDGRFVYLDNNAPGAETRYQFTGDEYVTQVSTNPSQNVVEGWRFMSEEFALAVDLPYSILVNARDVGGAPSRLEMNLAGNEFGRIHEMHKAKLDVISYIYIMDAVSNGTFPARSGITNGWWSFPNKPVADAFKDSMDDIKSVRAGQESDTRVLARYGTSYKEIMRESLEQKFLRRRVVVHEKVCRYQGGSKEAEKICHPSPKRGAICSKERKRREERRG